mgnify:CR=1 FL=1
MQSLTITDTTSKDECNVNAEEETKQCVDHLIRILKNKTSLLSRSSPNRRKVKELDQPLLDNLMKWLLGLTFRPETEARRKAMEILYQVNSSDKIRAMFGEYLKEKCSEFL